MIPGRGGLVVAFKLLYVDVRDNVGVKEGCNDVHLLNFKVVMTCKGEEDSDCGVPDGRGKYGGVVEVLHVASSDEAGYILDDGTGAISLDLVFP